MGTTELAIAQLGMSALGAFGASSAARAESAAATQQSQMEIEELQRQQDEATSKSREEKSDRAREADKLMGQMLAVMADNGGAGTANEARFAGEIGYLEGLDLARIEGNRRRKLEALDAAKTASGWRALNIISGAGAHAQGAIWNVAKTGFSVAEKVGKKNKETEKGTPPRAPGKKPRTDAAGRILGGI